MKQLPPFILTITLLFWGWLTNQWIAAILAAGWVEWALRTRRRWQISNENIHRIVDLTSLALIGIALYEYQNNPFAQSIFTMLHWSPVLFLPLLSAQLLSGRPGLERRALYYSKRKSKSPSAKKEVDLLFPYFTACLMAPGLSPAIQAAYLPGVILIITWLLWWNRPRTKQINTWIMLLTIAVGLGYLGQIGLRQAQTELENAAIEWLTEQFSNNTNPYKARTSLGDIGELKLSDSILYRVETDKPLFKPLLLRTATYNRYLETSWFNHHRKFVREKPKADGDSWQWIKNEAELDDSAIRWTRISLYPKGKKHILPAPSATHKIEQLPAARLSRHPLGAIQITEPPELIRFKTHFGKAVSTDAPPEEPDLSIPKWERETLEQIANELRLSGLAPNEAAQRIKAFLKEEFHYTLELPGKSPNQTALSHFLLERRRGHCEYFASATVLLLRQAGIPARYAVGYSTQEAAGPPRKYLVRVSHAHAWAQYWHDGKWWELDTTPSNWYQFEADQAPLWRPLLDFISNLYYNYANWQLNRGEEKQPLWLWGVLALLFLILGYRLRPGKAFKLIKEKTQPKKIDQVQTPLSDIEKILVTDGYPRHTWETYGAWLNRLQEQSKITEASQQLEEILQLHYRHRYLDAGLNQNELQQMQTLANNWIKGYKTAQNSPDS